MYMKRLIRNRKDVIFYHVKQRVEFSNNPYALLSTRLSKQIVVKLLIHLNESVLLIQARFRLGELLNEGKWE